MPAKKSTPVDLSLGQKSLAKAIAGGRKALGKLPPLGHVPVDGHSFSHLTHPGCFALQIVGTCLAPYFMPGDIAIIDPENPPDEDRLIAVITPAGDASIKVLLDIEPNGYRVARTNPLEEVYIAKRHLAKAMRVVGVVTPQGVECAKYPLIRGCIIR